MASTVVTESPSTTSDSNSDSNTASAEPQECQQDSAVSTTSLRGDKSKDGEQRQTKYDRDSSSSSISSSTTPPSPTSVTSKKIHNNQQIRGGPVNSENHSDDDDDDESSNEGVNGSMTRRRGDDLDDDSSSRDDAVDSKAFRGGQVFPGSICTPSSGFSLQSQQKPQTNPFASSSSSTHRPILRPSAFKFSSTSTTPTPSLLSAAPVVAQAPPAPQQQQPSSSNFVLRPPKLIPTAKNTSVTSSTTPTKIQNSTPQFVPLEKDSEQSEAEGSSSGQSTTAPKKVDSNTFVFGSNLSERGIPGENNAPTTSGTKRKMDEDKDNNGDCKKPSVLVSSPDDKHVFVENSCGNSSLHPLQVVTGEEDEVNVLQLQCRLFIFDSTTSSWIERGRGLLKLNDSKQTSEEKKDEPASSRLIIRTKGSLRVMLNTKVWEGMSVEKASDKSVRIMAVDLEATTTSDRSSAHEDEDGPASALRVFLIMTTSVSDASTLTSALKTRVQRAVVANQSSSY